jgi:hypothetical protein
MIQYVAMILPERTVDAWTATYITGRRWRARLWAPTEQKLDEAYDLSVGVGKVKADPRAPHTEQWPNKVFAFEHKGVDESNAGAPIIWIRLRQLLNHFHQDLARGGGLVYYLLPDPEWNRHQPAPYGTLPDVTVRRTRGPGWDGFQKWAMVAHVADVLTMTLPMFSAASTGRRKSRHSTRSQPHDRVCAIGMPELRRIRDRLSLRDFVTAVRKCERGRLLTDPGLLPPTPPPGDEIGPSRDDLTRALWRATERVPRAAEAARTDEQRDDVLTDVVATDVFDRPAFLTFYGIGDSDLDG